MAYNYPYGNGQQLNLDWFLNEWKNLLAAWDAEKNGIEGALQAEIDRAEAALADVFAARDAAAQSAANALESKNAAAQSASDASGYLSTVQQNATAAQNAAQSAAQSESNAADYAQTALASKNAAGQSETAAGNSASAAAQSETAAGNSASAAAQSETAAGNSASAAAQSAEDAETYAQEIPDLKNSINNGFRSIFPTMLFPAKAMCRGTLSGANFVDGHAFGNLQDSTNATVTGNENILPTADATASMLDDYFSVYLTAGSYTMNIECGYAEYTERSLVAALYYAEKTERVPAYVGFSNSGLMKPNAKLTANFNITLEGWYVLRIYFPNATPLNFKYWLTSRETSTAAMLLENM